MIARIALSTVCIAAGTALADPPFIESPLPPEVAAPAPAPAPAPTPTKEEIERAAREARQKPAPRSDAERVRGDIDRARERVDTDRRIDRAAKPKP